MIIINQLQFCDSDQPVVEEHYKMNRMFHVEIMKPASRKQILSSTNLFLLSQFNFALFTLHYIDVSSHSCEICGCWMMNYYV
jgi:hypothetical protein